MPYVSKVRKIKGTTLYGSRTLFFLNSDGTLMPLDIELTRPPMDGHLEQLKEVFTPGTNSTDVWLWRLAKAHVLSHDSCIHQLVIHWYVCLYIYIHTYMHACKYIFLIKYSKCYAGSELIVVWSHMPSLQIGN